MAINLTVKSISTSDNNVIINTMRSDDSSVVPFTFTLGTDIQTIRNSIRNKSQEINTLDSLLKTYQALVNLVF